MRGKVTYRNGQASYFLHGGGLAGWEKVTKAAYDRAFPDKPFGVPMGAPPSCWPLESHALATLPQNARRAAAAAKAKGVPTDFTRDGKPVFRDRAHRKAFLKAYQVHDNQGGYGDG